MDPQIEHPQTGGATTRASSRFSRFIMHIVLPGTALLCGILITVYLLNTGPQARPAQRKPSATLVEVRSLQVGPQQTLLNAMGEIIPAREVALLPQVNGLITATSSEFQLGGFFQAGEEMLFIDGKDYELALKQIETDVAKAESELALEMGNQRIAERELSLLGEEVSSDDEELILRRPQLARLQAARDDALARLAQARLDLERTTSTAPFNGVLTHKTVDIGAKVGEATTLATIVGTDSFWLKLTLPVEQLQWLDIPQRSGESGATVTIYPQGSVTADRTRLGEIVRLVSGLEEQGRMAQLLVRVEDPLCLNEGNKEKPKLLLGSYVRAEIHGITIDSGYTIARGNLRDGSTVWLMDDQGKLDIRPVEVAYRGHEQVIVTGGIDEGERLVVTALSSPVMGTPLRTSEESSPQRQVTAQEDTDSTSVKHVN